MFIHSTGHWVVSVPEGRDEADRIAEDHGLKNAGEVLPGSNLFHMKIHENSKNRRQGCQMAKFDPFLGLHQGGERWGAIQGKERINFAA